MSGAKNPCLVLATIIATTAALVIAVAADAPRDDVRDASAAALSLRPIATAARSEAASSTEQDALLAEYVPVVCFAPGTDPSVVQSEAQRRAALRTSLQPSPSGARHQFADGNRWSMTATNGYVPTQGQPITLTWSVVPDGTAISGFGGEAASPSNFIAYMNGKYGSPAAWLPIIQAMFERWSEVAGVTYVYESHDDGATFPSASGQLGVRGDVRLSGHTIDGNYGVLAYNFYPNTGDMVIDTADVWFSDLSNNWLRMRNVMAHEHGHGLGMPHTCPINSTKLMEPYASLAFDGPQHDDILAGNRGYGDPLESNDSPAAATPLGALSNTTVNLDGLSIDDDSDVDYFSFSVAAGKTATVSVTPVGQTYLNGPQNPDGTCSAGTSYATLAIADLDVQLIAQDGTTVVATGAGQPAGSAETLSQIALPGAGGTYYVKVYGGSTSNAQLYDLSLTIGDAAPPPDKIFNSGFEPGNLAWSSSATGGGDLATVAGGAMFGTQSLVATVNDTAKLWVEDDTPSNEARYRARFYVDESAYTPAAGGTTTLFTAYSSTLGGMQKLVVVTDRMVSNQHQVRARTLRDDGTWAATAWQALPNGPVAIEIDWQKASAPGANDGHLSLWVGGALVQTVSGLGNQLRFVDSVRLGVLTVAAGSTGTIRFDGFMSKRSKYIGP